MADVTFNIYGGNNQILPNATKAEQNFYGDQFAEKTLAKDGARAALVASSVALAEVAWDAESIEVALREVPAQLELKPGMAIWAQIKAVALIG